MRERVLSGMRPSGKLHLGHLHGALANWRELQERYDSYFFVADWHALTSEYANPAAIRENGRQMVLDWLAAGIDPAKAVIFVQSQVLEHAELHLLLSMITPLSWLERCPTYKEQLEQVKDKDLHTYGFLGYPVLQTADIVMYLANWVPVGVDQLPHLELAREIVRRFHFLYGEGVLVEPQPKLTEFPKIPGTDGRKMSKSYGNSIFLSDTAAETGKKILPMVTDPARVRRTDPGEPEVCPVFTLHRVSTPEGERDRLAAGCRSAGIGCIDCKRTLVETLNGSLVPLRRRRDELAAETGLVERILADGTARARAEAASVMAAVRRAVRL